MKKRNYQSIEEYIGDQSDEVQQVLEGIRQAIEEADPDAVEVISYQMPTFRQNGFLAHFGAYKHHIGFYPTPIVIKEFEKELNDYESAIGSVKFPLDEPMPLDLIKDMVRFKVKKNLENS